MRESRKLRGNKYWPLNRTKFGVLNRTSDAEYGITRYWCEHLGRRAEFTILELENARSLIVRGVPARLIYYLRKQLLA